MRSLTRRLAGLLIGLALTVGVASAQTTINSTTLSAAVTKTQNFVQLTSTSTVAVGDILFVDREAMVVTTVPSSGTTIYVRRGSAGLVSAHASGATIYTGTPDRFSRVDVAGSCSATDGLFTPHINISAGNIFLCTNSVWRPTKLAGVSVVSAATTTSARIASGTITLDGSNPSTATISDFTTILNCTVSYKAAAIPGDDPLGVSATWATNVLSIYAWKTDGVDPTPVASTNNSAIYAYICVGY